MKNQRSVRASKLAWMGASLAVCAIATAASAAESSTTDASSTSAEEVIVTATRREEAVQDVPISITAMTAKEVTAARIQTFADVFLKIPGTSFLPIKGSSQSTPMIRGQASNNESPALDVPIGMFIDDVYYGGPASYSSDFYDIDQIAVLKGPQGTTFGRNVVGGAIQVNSRRPSLGVDSGEISATIKNYHGFETRGAFNHAIGDELAVRLAFSAKQRDGYDHNVTTGANINDEKIWSARGSVRYEPNETFDALAIVSYTRQNNFGDAPKYVGPGSLTASQSRDAHTVYLSENGINRRNILSAVVNLSWNTDFGKVSSITGFHDLKGRWRNDVDARPTDIFWPADNDNKESALSEEVRLVSPSGRRIEYVVGLYGSVDHAYKYLDLSTDGCDTTLFFNTLNTTGASAGQPCKRYSALNQGVHINTVAPYGEAKWNITDQFAVTIGGRYSYISKKGYTNHLGAPSFSYGAAFHAPFDDSWTSFTPRGVLQWKPREDSMIFISASKGFKGGGFSESAVSQVLASTALRPERSVSYEIGTKNQFFDRRLTANLTIYEAITKDLQTKNFVGAAFIETNAGEVTVKGLELELAVRPMTGVILGVNYAYTDAYYSDFKNCTASHLDCTGHQFPYSAKNDMLAYGQYNLALSSGAGLEFRGDIKFTDPIYFEQTNSVNKYARPLTRIRGLVNASVLYRPAQGAWDFQLWAKNLTDKDYVVFGANYYFFAATKAEVASGLNDISRVIFGAPRTVGGTLSVRF